ncbi:MAG: WD40 repeat domain-containing protein [candidate division WOR-3 bacterium]|nr:WD40 repeat domain-containing protein [candidate division WOR-3 bacterium]
MVKKASIVLVAVLLTAIPLAAQTGWINTYGEAMWDWGRWVEQTADGGYVLTGQITTHGEPGPFEWVYLIKTDPEGDTLWTRAWGGKDVFSRLGNQGYCIQCTSDGGYVIVGLATMGLYVWLIKTDEDGDTLWTRIYESGKDAHCIRQTPDGGYVITGVGGSGSGDLWLLKTDEHGDSLWARLYGEQDGQKGYSVQVTTDGGCIITGYTGYERGMWLLKTDENGDTLWTRVYKIRGENTDRGHCVQLTKDGGYVICGAADPHPFGESGYLFLLKTDSLGDSLWAKVYGGSDYDEGRFVCQTPDAGYIITGVKGLNPFGTTGYLWLLKTDSLGDTLWTRLYGENENDAGECVQLTADGGYIITGYTKSYGTDGSRDIWLIKTDSLDNVAVAEEPHVTPVTQSDWQIPVSVGRRIVLQYTDRPQGFHAQVFDASGRKVDEVHATESSGMIAWGRCYGPGVYFIVPTDGEVKAQKVILIK